MKKAFLFVLTALILTFSAYSQNAGQPAFNAAVDRINCETIRFIHREAGRAEIANNMECFTFESILKSIPDDEASTTQRVSKDIEAFKSKFSADKELATQLNAVIAYAAKRIKAKPRKFNVGDFEQKLQEIKNEAIANANVGAPEGSANNATEQPAAGNNNVSEDEDDGETVVDTAENEEPTEINWLGWLSLFLSGAAMIFAFLAYRRSDEALNRGVTYAPSPENTVMADNSAELSALENRMQRELDRIDRSVNEKISAITASTGYTAPERDPHTTTYTGPLYGDTSKPTVAKIMEVEEPEEDETVYMPTPVDQADAPDVTEVFERQEEAIAEEHKDEFVEEPGIEEPVNDEYVVETEEVKEPKQPQRIVHNLDDDIVEEEDITEQPVTEEKTRDEQPEAGEEIIDEEPETEEIPQQDLRSDSAAAAMPVTPMPTGTDEDEEEAEGLPQYYYTGLPDAQGNFTDAGFTEFAGADSIYEVEMYDDVPNKAFIAPLQTPEVIAKAVANANELLAPCCDFTNSPEGNESFIVVEEGILRKEGDHWHIYQKAKIRFD